MQLNVPQIGINVTKCNSKRGEGTDLAEETTAKEKELKPIVIESLEPIFNGRYGEPFYKLDGGNRLTVPLSVFMALGNRFTVFRDIVENRFFLYPTDKWDVRSRIMRDAIFEAYPDNFDEMEEMLITNESRQMTVEVFPSKNKIQLTGEDVQVLGIGKGDRITILGKWDCIELRRTDLLEQRKTELPSAQFMRKILHDN